MDIDSTPVQITSKNSSQMANDDDGDTNQVYNQVYLGNLNSTSRIHSEIAILKSPSPSSTRKSTLPMSARKDTTK